MPVPVSMDEKHPYWPPCNAYVDCWLVSIGEWIGSPLQDPLLQKLRTCQCSLVSCQDQNQCRTSSATLEQALYLLGQYADWSAPTEWVVYHKPWEGEAGLKMTLPMAVYGELMHLGHLPSVK